MFTLLMTAIVLQCPKVGLPECSKIVIEDYIGQCYSFLCLLFLAVIYSFLNYCSAFLVVKKHVRIIVGFCNAVHEKNHSKC